MQLMRNTTWPEGNLLTNRRVLIGFALLLFAVLLLAVAGSVIAQDRQRRIAPREVTTPPDLSRAVYIGPGPAQHTGRRWVEVAGLNAHLGRPVLLPSPGVLPAGCDAQERFVMEGIEAVGVLYSCVGLVQWAGANGAAPAVAPGSAQDVTVAGQPALFIDGTWVTDPGGATTWQRGDRKLIFDRDGMVIELRAYGGNLGVPDAQGRAAFVPNVWTLGRDDLIRIAESLAPAP